MLREEGDFVREYIAILEENFIRSWLWEGTEGKANEGEEMEKEDQRSRDKEWEKEG